MEEPAGGGRGCRTRKRLKEEEETAGSGGRVEELGSGGGDGRCAMRLV